MRISLVTGSLFRPDFLHRLFGSLSDQLHSDFQLILVEQSNLSGATSLASMYSSVDSVVVESARGLSRARNSGMRLADGDVFGFPDDDCWYSPGTLRRVVHRFSEDPQLSILCGRVMTPSGPMLKYPSGGWINRRNVWRTAVSPGLFVRASAVRSIGSFNEDLGVGAGTLAGSGEETEFVLRGLSLGMKALYDPLLHVAHPSPESVPNRLSADLGFRYGYGMGQVLQKQEFGLREAGLSVARPLIGSAVAQATGNRELADFRRAVASGRARGYLRARRGAVA